MNLASVETKKSERSVQAPVYLDAERVVTPEPNPVYTPSMLEDLLESIREHGQLVPGWVCPSPELPEPQRICIEGNRRLAVARLLGQPFWAFDLGRFVPEDERIRLTFSHNFIRRRMSMEEIAEWAARYIEITRATQGEAARQLNVSPATLSRAFGEKRIPADLRVRAERLGLSIRALIAAMPEKLMARAVEYAEAPDASGKKRTRDQIASYLHQLRKGVSKDRKPKAVTLRVGGRAVTLTVGDRDTAAAVAEDLKSIAGKLAGKLAEVPPDGWPYHFQ